MQSCLKRPQYLIIELEGTQDWFENLQETVKFDLCLPEMMEFYLTQFKKKHEAILNLEYSLMEMHSENSRCGTFDKESNIILNECQQLGVRLFNYLDKLGCFQNDNLSYCFATVLGKDTFMFWRPTSNDVYY